MSLPLFDDLPGVKGMPKGCAWGVFDKEGKKDRLGTLNLLTSKVVKEAKVEIQEGESVALDLPLDFLKTPAFGRKKFERRPIANNTANKISCDDELHINTQSCSQWDGHCHFGYKSHNLFYNGVSLDEIMNCENVGIETWVDNGGIVGRGVLLDYVEYAQKHGIEYSPVDRHEITVKELEEIAQEQGVEFKEGDILIVRSGLTKWYKESANVAKFDEGKFVGIEGGIDSARWFWNKRFAAVAGDTTAFEAWPPKQFDEHSLHFYLLAMQGMPLGELWNLEKLSEKCKKLGRYTFFLTSAPLHVIHGIASPPNAIAIF
ncbi:hypothetical protein TRICI_001121 [Trichomonascus ciferrii]|uniref:Cyclase n=1 Tax=Trichomonascus ciferrii TaxID=44093 RepID=A0A642VCL3_9ASCO|nr:hypothetical protein TRICI_001121 [Trichomonascus ciferrii]